MGPVRPQVPGLGEVHHLRQHPERPVGLVGLVLHVVMQRRHLFPPQRQHTDRPQRRKDVAVHRMPVLHLGAGLAVQGDVLFQEALRQLRHRRRQALGLLLPVRVPAVVDVGDDLARPGLGLLEGQDAVAADLDADGLAFAEELGDVALSAVGIDARAEALQNVVPDEILLLAHGKVLDITLGELGHDPLGMQLELLSLKGEGIRVDVCPQE